MSTDAVALVKSRRVGSAATKAILFVLADYADSEWSSFASQKRIAAEAEVGERTVRRTLADLESKGILRRERRHRSDGTRTSDRLLLVQSALKRLPAALAAGDSEGDYRPHRPNLPATVTATTGHSLAAHEPSVEPSGEPLRVRDGSGVHGIGGVRGGNAEFDRTIRTVAEEIADRRIAEGYDVRKREGYIRGLMKSPEVRNEAIKRSRAPANVLELLEGIGRIDEAREA